MLRELRAGIQFTSQVKSFLPTSCPPSTLSTSLFPAPGISGLSITAPGSLYITVRQVTSSPDSSFSHHRPAEAVGELGSWKEGDRYQVSGIRFQVTGANAFFYILPSTDSEMAIGQRRWASGRIDEATGVQAVRVPPCRRLAVPKPEIPNKFKTKTLRNQPRNTRKKTS